MKSITIIIIVFFLHHKTHSQSNTFQDTAAVYFTELEKITRENKQLWNLDLYAPILLVDPVTRKVFANAADTAGVLIKKDKVYTGLLPLSVNISNTSIKWSGKHWAMIMLPLPKNNKSRINLLCHELFHRAQQELGFTPSNPENNHLDKKDGRIYLRLELEALKKAITGFPEKDYKQHLHHAFLFRKIRHQLYPGSDSTENLLEMNEGLSEFTGVMMSGRSKQEIAEHFINRINNFISSNSYIRSFAYETIPVYGYILSFTQPGWNKSINNKTDLTSYFKNAFVLMASTNEKDFDSSIRNKYGYNQISVEETNRENHIKKLLSEYKSRFIDSPHFELPLIKMNMSFDYTRMIALEQHGTIYPQIRITDNWGILDVENGAMINSTWTKIHVGYPKRITGNKIEGDGWILQLNDEYVLHKDGFNNYTVKKKE